MSNLDARTGVNITIPISPRVIHRALPHLNRWAGNTVFPWSVAQHSLLCVHLAATRFKSTDPLTLWHLLMHDAAEAFTGEIPRPVKLTYMTEDFYGVETALYQKICDEYRMPRLQESQAQILSKVDMQCALIESDQLVPGPVLMPDVTRYSVGALKASPPALVRQFFLMVKTQLADTHKRQEEAHLPTLLKYTTRALFEVPEES